MESSLVTEEALLKHCDSVLNRDTFDLGYERGTPSLKPIGAKRIRQTAKKLHPGALVGAVLRRRVENPTRAVYLEVRICNVRDHRLSIVVLEKVSFLHVVSGKLADTIFACDVVGIIRELKDVFPSQHM